MLLLILPPIECLKVSMKPEKVGVFCFENKWRILKLHFIKNLPLIAKDCTLPNVPSYLCTKLYVIIFIFKANG